MTLEDRLVEEIEETESNLRDIERAPRKITTLQEEYGEQENRIGKLERQLHKKEKYHKIRVGVAVASSILLPVISWIVIGYYCDENTYHSDMRRRCSSIEDAKQVLPSIKSEIYEQEALLDPDIKQGYKTQLKEQKAHLEDLREQVPEIKLHMPVKEFVKNRYAQAIFRFSNDGTGDVKNLRVRLDGFYDGEKELSYLHMTPNRKKQFSIQIKPTEYGEMQWSVEATFEDTLGRPYRKSWKPWVNVESEKGVPSVVGGDFVGGDKTTIDDSVVMRSKVGR